MVERRHLQNLRFLLARLYVDSLAGKTTVKAVKNALKQLHKGPKAYDHAYDAAMERIEGQLDGHKDLARRALSWIICAKRPLLTWELQQALAVEIGEPELDEDNITQIEEMVSVCAGLVTVDEESCVIRLVHYTTQEYFQRTLDKWFPSAEKDITTICVTYLSFGQFEEGACNTDEKFEQRLKDNPLYEYSARNWGHHARTASISIEKVLSFLNCHHLVEGASQALLATNPLWGQSNYSQNYPKQTGIHVAAYFGAEQIVRELISMELLFDSRDTYGQTPLSWAAGNGHDAVVKLLLEKGANIETTGNDGRTPLSWAAGNGYDTVVKLLLEKGANIETTDKDSRTPLSWAAGNGYDAVVKFLEKGANPSKADLSETQGGISGVTAVIARKQAKDMT